MMSSVGHRMYLDLYPYLVHPIGLRAYNLDWMSLPLKYYLHELLGRAKALHCTIEDELRRRREAESMPANQFIVKDKSEIMFLGHNKDAKAPGFWSRDSLRRFNSRNGDNWKDMRCTWLPADGGTPPKTTRRRLDEFDEGTNIQVATAPETPTGIRRTSAITNRGAPAQRGEITPSGHHIYGSSRASSSSTAQPYASNSTWTGNHDQWQDYNAWGSSRPASSSKGGGGRGQGRNDGW